MVNRIGATARSWKSSTEKLARPDGALSRFCSASTGITIAVEESASARPIRAAAMTLCVAIKARIATASVQSQHLQGAEPEHKAPQNSQALPGQLDPDREQQEHDAELCQMRGLVPPRDGHPIDPGILRHDAPEPIRAEQRARAEESQHRADPQPMEQRHDDARRGEEKHRFLKGA